MPLLVFHRFHCIYHGNSFIFGIHMDSHSKKTFTSRGMGGVMTELKDEYHSIFKLIYTQNPQRRFVPIQESNEKKKAFLLLAPTRMKTSLL